MRIFLTFVILVSFFICTMANKSKILQAAEMHQQSSENSFYYSGFNQTRTFAANTGGSSSLFSDFDLGSVHKILGYTTIAAALTAAFTGIASADAYNNDKKPSSTLTRVHRASATGTLGLAIGSCTTGIIAFSDMVSFKDGINSYNSHATMAVLSTLGFMISAAMAPESEGKTLKRKDYAKHGAIAEISGGIMLGSAIIIHF
jgi:hypothetical protein